MLASRSKKTEKLSQLKKEARRRSSARSDYQEFKLSFVALPRCGVASHVKSGAC